jgi:chemotaxis protein histidine kinase CheA/ActR/RegA family two-component response regulator
MSLDPELHDQARQLFLQEALELLEQIQQGLSALQRDNSLSQTHSLVRSIELLKSGAAQLNLTDVYDLAHRFENILRSIWQTSFKVHGELSELLRQAHRCLHLTLLSRLTMKRQDSLGFLAEAESVLSHIEELLHQPQSSSELPTAIEVEGELVDVMETLLNKDVSQALEQLEVSLNQADASQLTTEVAAQIEILLSLGELLEISEFVTIAQIALANLQASPQSTSSIGFLALNDFQVALNSRLQRKTATTISEETTANSFSQPLLKTSEAEEERLIPIDLTLEEILNEPVLSSQKEKHTNNRESAKTDFAELTTSEVTLKTTKLFVWQANFMVFTLPYDNIEEYLIPKADRLTQSEGQRFLAWREQTIPLYSLSQLLSSDVFLPSIEPSWSSHDRAFSVLVVRIDSLLLGLEVAIEKLVTEPELSLQTFGETRTSDSYFLGCTYLLGTRLMPAIDITVLLAQKIDFTQTTASTTTLSNLLNAAIADKIAANQAALSEVAPHLPTLLVVEDSLTWRQFLVFTLQKAGYRVLQARDGQEGLKLLQEDSTILSIVTDLEMPNLNGFGFLICCRQDPTLMRVPFVVLSNYSSEQHRQLAMQLGANAYFSKPYDEGEFLATIAALIREHKVNSTF